MSRETDTQPATQTAFPGTFADVASRVLPPHTFWYTIDPRGDGWYARWSSPTGMWSLKMTEVQGNPGMRLSMAENPHADDAVQTWDMPYRDPARVTRLLAGARAIGSNNPLCFRATVSLPEIILGTLPGHAVYEAFEAVEAEVREDGLGDPDRPQLRARATWTTPEGTWRLLVYDPRRVPAGVHVEGPGGSWTFGTPKTGDRLKIICALSFLFGAGALESPTPPPGPDDEAPAGDLADVAMMAAPDWDDVPDDDAADVDFDQWDAAVADEHDLVDEFAEYEAAKAAVKGAHNALTEEEGPAVPAGWDRYLNAGWRIGGTGTGPTFISDSERVVQNAEKAGKITAAREYLDECLARLKAAGVALQAGYDAQLRGVETTYQRPEPNTHVQIWPDAEPDVLPDDLDHADTHADTLARHRRLVAAVEDARTAEDALERRIDQLKAELADGPVYIRDHGETLLVDIEQAARTCAVLDDEHVADQVRRRRAQAAIELRNRVNRLCDLLVENPHGYTDIGLSGGRVARKDYVFVEGVISSIRTAFREVLDGE